MHVEFTVPGVPVAQPRQRHRIIGGRVGNYTPANSPVNAWKASVVASAVAAHRGKLMDGPLEVSMLFVFPRPSSRTRKRSQNPREPKSTKPDCDNLAKACLDCLNHVVFQDDAQVWSLTVRKLIAAGGEAAHMVMSITESCDATQKVSE